MYPNEIHYYDMRKTTSNSNITQYTILIIILYYVRITFASSSVLDSQQRIVKTSDP